MFAGTEGGPVSKLFMSALLASIAAGIPDVFVAAQLSRASPGRVIQTIASWVLGEASYMRGSASMALGLGLQIAMSFVIALIYNVAFSYVAGIHRSPLIFGALYGVAIFIVMNFVVVPLSRAYPRDLKSVVAMLIVMVPFGELISLIAAAFAEAA